MKNYFIIFNLLLFCTFSSFILKTEKMEDEYKYLKEVNGIRIYYSVKAYSPKPGKAAKKVVFKLKNATKTPKSLTFKAKVSDEAGASSTATMTLCLKANEENLKQEIVTDFTDVKAVAISGEKTTEGGC